VVRPIAKLAAIWRVDNPSAESRKTSRIFRIGNLIIGLPSCQKGGR
jgi:hypothetical protein